MWGQTENITWQFSFKDEMKAEVLHSAEQFLSNYACKLVYKKLCNITFPEPFVMGYKHQRVKCHLVRKRLLGYRVPFKKQIERLLNLPKFGIFFKIPGYQMILFLEMCVMVHMLKNIL